MARVWQPMSPTHRDLLILALALAVSVLAWVMALNQVRFEKKQATEAAFAQNSDRALILQEYVSRTLRSADMTMLHVAELHALGRIAGDPAGSVGRIDDPVVRDPAFLGLSVVDVKGEIVASTLSGTQRTPNVTAHPAFSVHKTGQIEGMFVSKPAYSRLLQNPTIWLSRRLDRDDGSFAGVVAINEDPAQLTAVFGRTAVKPSEIAWVAGLDGTIRSRRTGNTVSSGEDVSHGAVFRSQRRFNEGQIVSSGTLDGKMRLISHRRVPGYPLFVSYSILEEEVLRGAQRRARVLRTLAALISAAALTIAILIVYALRQRERRARELAASKQRLEAAQRIAKVGDWTRSNENGTITWSPQLYEIFERDPALGPIGEELTGLLTDETVKRMKLAVRALVENGEPASWEMQVRLPSGRAPHLLVHAVPMYDAHGKVVGFHGTTQDVTERKTLEALQDELAHLARVGAMNALTATLSHELNQPLAAATNYLAAGQSIAAKSADPNAARMSGMMAAARDQVVRAGEIIQKIRDLVTKGRSHRSVTSIDPVIAEALVVINVTRACRGPVSVRPAAEELLVLVDSVQIQQVILNLVRNACEAQADRGVEAPRIEVSVQSDTYAEVSVVDTGPGLPAHVLRTLFDPFSSSKQSGLGLGLSISRTIVEAHGGTMQARNNPAGGATISFSLPLHGRQPHSTATA